MGVLESVAAIATALTALIALGLKLWKNAQASKQQKYADRERDLSVKIAAATTDEERMKYAKELYDLRSSR